MIPVVGGTVVHDPVVDGTVVEDPGGRWNGCL